MNARRQSGAPNIIGSTWFAVVWRRTLPVCRWHIGMSLLHYLNTSAVFFCSSKHPLFRKTDMLMRAVSLVIWR